MTVERDPPERTRELLAIARHHQHANRSSFSLISVMWSSLNNSAATPDASASRQRMMN
jgi:hypothetical protein